MTETYVSKYERQQKLLNPLPANLRTHRSAWPICSSLLIRHAAYVGGGMC